MHDTFKRVVCHQITVSSCTVMVFLMLPLQSPEPMQVSLADRIAEDTIPLHRRSSYVQIQFPAAPLQRTLMVLSRIRWIADYQFIYEIQTFMNSNFRYSAISQFFIIRKRVVIMSVGEQPRSYSAFKPTQASSNFPSSTLRTIFFT